MGKDQINEEVIDGELVVEDLEDIEDDDVTEEEEPETTEEIDPNEVPTYSKNAVSRIVTHRLQGKNARIAELKADKELLEELAGLAGLTTDQLKTRLVSMPAEEKARIMGVPVGQVQGVMSTSKAQRMLDEQQRNLQLKTEETQLMSKKEYADFEDYRDEVYETLERFPQMSLAEAYILAKGSDGYKDVERKTEQRVIQQRVNNAKPVVKTGGSAKAPVKMTLSTEERRIAANMGISPEEYVAYSKVSSLDGVQKLKRGK